MEKKVIRIGTRDSQLALWQAKKVQQLLEEAGNETELVPVKSEGDLDLVTPLYAMGVQGVFTKTLDAFLLSNKIDIAVHSMKDVPTQLAQGIVQAAVLPRADVHDILVLKTNHWEKKENNWERKNNEIPFHIGTGSVRRKAQWLNKYPDSKLDNLRGNVQTRLRKLEENEWDGAIFAAAGLDRVSLLPENSFALDWMLPAPAQGAIMIVCRQEEVSTKSICASMNHEPTALCVRVERDFLRTLMGGCSTPIGAYAYIADAKIHFKGNILSPDGKHKQEIELRDEYHINSDIGMRAAKELLKKGAGSIIEEIRQFEKDN
ncbi:MAG: hydroxymethylbilane synthase [Pseudopedobacter saltans]|uniref:Hydroxymethylbilane synthase n=1 Tax=Pseudopedobacter saltans TaxID=151895 RepID=A0A2W5F2P5_9SPHI|nr:MAG: hydroxymethylbilane synthase [Pseudopedobacter saltans]